MKLFYLSAASLRAALCLVVASSFFFFHLSSAQDGDVCKPYNEDPLSPICTDDDDPWSSPEVTYIEVKPGEINCRYRTETPEEVTWLTCSHLAYYYELSYDRFFFLNPDLKKDCSNIKPKTEYCVVGFIEPIRAFDGLCGPQHNNATCIGTGKQCCNAETWTCGNSPEDCAPGTCYEGACAGDTVYSTDGTCGQFYGNRVCTGRWGKCCSIGGLCGTGEAFCGFFNCQSGDCDRWKPDEQPASTKWTEDGTCGGEEGMRCSSKWGRCCNANGVCGEEPADCYVEQGCQNEFGICASNSTPPASATVEPPTPTFTQPSTANRRIFWTLNGPLESSIKVAPNRYYEPGDIMEPYFRPGDADSGLEPSWHPVSQETLMEPPITTVTVRVLCLDEWEDLWVELNRECHDTKNHPLRPRAKHIQLEVTTSGEFLTIHEFVSAVHPWLMGMRERLTYSLGMIDGKGVPWPPETELTVLWFGPGPIWIGREEGWAWWHEKPKSFAYKSPAEREKNHLKVIERMKAISAARIRELERLRQEGNEDPPVHVLYTQI